MLFCHIRIGITFVDIVVLSNVLTNTDMLEYNLRLFLTLTYILLLTLSSTLTLSLAFKLIMTLKLIKYKDLKF